MESYLTPLLIEAAREEIFGLVCKDSKLKRTLFSVEGITSVSCSSQKRHFPRTAESDADRYPCPAPNESLSQLYVLLNVVDVHPKKKVLSWNRSVRKRIAFHFSHHTFHTKIDISDSSSFMPCISITIPFTHRHDTDAVGPLPTSSLSLKDSTSTVQTGRFSNCFKTHLGSNSVMDIPFEDLTAELSVYPEGLGLG